MELSPRSLRLLYRGPLSSCNYDCHYCPFAKRHETAIELRRDRDALSRFLAWIEGTTAYELSLLFTPWGEALVRPWYQQSLVRLSHLPQVRRAAIQTNLSCRLDWLDEANPLRLSLWCTYHPSQITRTAFMAQCRELERRGIRYSAGVVGLRESFDDMERLREELSASVYLWINAYKDQPDYYTAEEIDRLERIDPLFRLNLARHPSLDRDCRAGESALSIDGDGNIRRCHFVSDILANLYDPDWERVLQPRRCPNATCGCYIGYVHRPQLQHEAFFGEGFLERLPDRPFHHEAAQRREAWEASTALLAGRNLPQQANS